MHLARDVSNTLHPPFRLNFEEVERHTTKPATTPIRRIINLLPRPGLKINRMQRLTKRHIPHGQALNTLPHILILSNTPNRNAQPPMEQRVLDDDIRRIRLETDTVVAVVDFPVAKGDLRAVDCVCAVGVARGGVGAGAVYVDVGEEGVSGMNDGESPFTIRVSVDCF